MYQITGFSLGTGMFGGVPTDGATFAHYEGELSDAIFGNEHVHAIDPNGDPFPGFLPGVPHEGPYDNELREGFAALGGIQTDVHLASEFRGAGILQFGFMFVPSVDAAVGASPDGDAVPVIPSDVFPITKTHKSFTRNGEELGNDPVEDDIHDLNILMQNLAHDATNLQLDMNSDDVVNVDDVHY